MSFKTKSQLKFLSNNMILLEIWSYNGSTLFVILGLIKNLKHVKEYSRRCPVIS